MKSSPAISPAPRSTRPVPVAGSRPRRASAGQIAGQIFAQYGLLVVFAAIVIVFSLAEPTTYFTQQNAQTIAASNAVVAVLALGAMVPLVVGQFDLSVGFQLGLAQTLCAGFMLKQGLPASVAMVLCMAVGVLIGAINGFLVVAVKMNSFIATLGTGTLAAGVTLWYSKGQSVFGDMPQSFLNLGRDDVLGIPLPMLYVVVLVALLWLAFEYTAWGRACFAIGGNARAALIAGVRVDRLTVQCFIAAGVFSSLAGILSVMILGSANPNVGTNFLLPAFAAAFLGATSIRPGRFNAIGTFVAVYLLAAGITGLQQLGAASYVDQFFYGAALLIAVALSGWAARRRRARVSTEG
jgi:ribose transport system permease protein